MLKTYLYLPEELDNQIKRVATFNKASKAETIRQVLKEGLEVVEAKKSKKGNAESLVKLAEIGNKNNLKGPKDASKNLDKYLWKNYEL